MTTPDVKEAAETYRLGLKTSFFSVGDVIRWADSVIVNSDEPDLSIVEVSLSHNRDASEVAQELGQVQGKVNPKIPLANLLSLMASRLRNSEINPERVAQILYHMLLSDEEMLGEEAERIHHVEDAFYLARQEIYGTRDEAVRYLLDFLDEYSARLKDAV